MCTFEKFYLHLSPAVIKSLVMFANSKIIICILELKLYLAPAVIKLQMSKEWKIRQCLLIVYLLYPFENGSHI